MKITVESIKENEDGSADCNIYLDEEAKDFLIRYAIIGCLTEAIENGRKATPPVAETTQDENKESLADE
jgi:hypothetical protein